MSKKPEPPEGRFSLKDQEFLRELGISVLPRGLEKALREQKAAKKAIDAIATKADGLQGLDLDEETLAKLSKEKNKTVAELRKDLQFFRDLHSETDEDPPK